MLFALNIQFVNSTNDICFILLINFPKQKLLVEWRGGFVLDGLVDTIYYTYIHISAYHLLHGTISMYGGKLKTLFVLFIAYKIMHVLHMYISIYIEYM